MLTLTARHETTFYPALVEYGVPPKLARGQDVVIEKPDGTVACRYPHYREDKPDRRNRWLMLNCYRYRLVWV